MKTFKVLLAFIITMSLQTSKAQSGKETIRDHTKTQTVTVYGECGMCKKRIEKAALSVEGVQSAVWKEDKKQLIIRYDLFTPGAMDNVQKKVAAAGHDTEKFKAEDSTYNKLPDCCHYQRKP